MDTNIENWNHNNHYHKYILNHLSENHDNALDVGSGDGSFSYLLSKIYKNVTGLEPDNNSYNCAKNKYQDKNRMNFINLKFDDFNSETKFDLIICIASIHNMDFENALIKVKRLLIPGGKLVIIGLYKESTFLDYFYSLLAIIPNLIRTRNFKNNNSDNFIKTMRAVMNISEIKMTASKILKEYKFKRHLYWRYSLIYQKEK